ncbi:MAG: NUDIX hydrolase, partial [Candidatus Paceibacterota bacterium]
MPQENNKPVKYAVSVVVRHPDKPGQFLSVKRPDNPQDPIGGMWGLPAVTMNEGEIPEDAARRVGPDKLGTEIKPTKWLGVKRGEREDHVLYLMDFEAELAGEGDEPDVSKAQTDSTVYAESRWTDDLDSLKPIAKHGSV